MTVENKLKLNLQIILPEAEVERDPCVNRLLDLLENKNGILEAHIKMENPQQPVLCIHFNQAELSLNQVRMLAESTGVELASHYGHLSIAFDSVVNPRQSERIQQQLVRLPGVLEASVSPIGNIFIEYDKQDTNTEELRSQVLSFLPSKALTKGRESHEHKHGDQCKSSHAHNHKDGHDHKDDHGHGHSHGGFLGEKTELIFAILSAVALATGWTINRFGLSASLPNILYGFSYFFGGYYTLKEAFANLKNRKFEIDSLMLLAAAGAAFLGEWPEGALLLVLFSLGHALEGYAMGRAKRAVEALAELAPETALVKRGAEFKEISVGELNPGDTILVKPNDRIAADGFVTKGESSVDQSPITGESVPVDKKALPVNSSESDKLSPLYRVFAGTINGPGAIEVQVTRASSESTLAKVVDMVKEADARKSPTQLFTDKFERIFVPVILVFVAILPFAFLVLNETWQQSLYRALAVLVSASPCALAIATPSAVLSAVARAAKGGVLVKGGAPLEELGSLQAIAFDKTGTLTEGRPKVISITPFKTEVLEHLLEVLVAVEKMSDHPLAAAIVRYGEEKKIIPKQEATQVKSIVGKGVSGIYDLKKIWIGKKGLFTEIAPLPAELATRVEELERSGQTVMIVKQEENFLGSVGMMDTPRESAKDAITKLKNLGVQRMIMLSGDNQGVASSVAQTLGLTDARGDLMPEDKVSVIKELMTKERVAMVGDGVNDAPAMVSATVGIAMGAAGSDVALQTADIALMADDLSALPFAVGLSRKARRIVKQNLWVSLGMVAFLVPATLLGLNIGMAVIAHEGSTVLVVVNALRLLAYKYESKNE